MYYQSQPHIPFHVHEPKIYNEYHLIKQWSAVKPGSQFTSQTGETITIINCGKLNRYDGPDFLNATIVIDGKLQFGSVECHVYASDWYKHGHDQNNRYDDVVLHVVNNYSSGKRTPNIPIVCLSPNSATNHNCTIPFQLNNNGLLNVLQYYAEQRWKFKTEQLSLQVC